MNNNSFIKWTVQHFELMRDKKLRINDVLLWQWYLLQNPFEDRPVKMIFEMIERDTGLGKDAYYRSRQKLTKLGLIKVIERDTEAVQGEKALRNNSESISENSETIRKKSEPVRKNSETISNNSESISENSETIRKNSESQELEVNDSKASISSQTNSDSYILNKTNSECVQTLTREGENSETHAPDKNVVKSFSLEEEREEMASLMNSLPKFESLKPEPAFREEQEIKAKVEAQEFTKPVAIEVEVLVNDGSASNASVVNVVTGIDKMTWYDFNWIDDIYANYRPSRWKANYPLKVKKTLAGLKETLKDLDGDVLKLQACVKNAFGRVENCPSLWGCSFAWVVSYENLQQLAWEYEAELSLAPSKRLQYQKQEKDVMNSVFEQLAEQYA